MRTTLQLLIILFFSQVLLGQPANDLCSNAEVISCGDNVQIDLTGATRDISPTQCGYLASNAVDAWYKITGNGDLIVLDLGTNSSYVDIWIYQGNCGDAVCLIHNNHRDCYVFEGVAGEDYLIRVVGDVSDQLSFSLNCQEVLPNEVCATARTITFGETISANTKLALKETAPNAPCYNDDGPGLWYSIVGEGHNVGYTWLEGLHTSMSIYKRDCNELVCVDEWNIDQFEGHYTYFEADTTYLLQVHRNDYDIGTTSIFYLDTFSIADNDLCENAKVVEYSDTISGHTRNATIGPSSTNPDLWYSFTGNDQSVRCEILTERDVIVSIYESGCIGPQLVSTNSGITFYAKAGKEYIFSVSTAYGTGEFAVTLNCIESPENNFCTGAAVLACNDLLTIDFTGLSADTTSYIYCSGNSDALTHDIWYTFQGDGKVHFMEVLQGLPVSFEIYDSICGGPCLSSATLYSRSEAFLTEISRTYIIRITAINSYPYEESVVIEFSCHDALPNDFCQGAIPLIEGATYIANLQYATSDQIPDCSVNADGVWYTISGNGMIHEINSSESDILFLATGSCNALICRSDLLSLNGQGRSFKSNIGETYYVLISKYNEPVSFTYRERNPAPNAECNAAESITCGGSIAGDLRATYRNGTQIACAIEDPAGLWYQFIGTDQFVELSYVSGNASTEVHIMKGPECNASTFSCVHSGNIYVTQSFIFFAERDTTYSLHLSDHFNPLPFEIGINCVDQFANNFCNGATPIVSDTVISKNTPYYVNKEFATNCGIFPGSSWYEVIGNDQWVDASIDNENLYLFEGDCFSLACPASHIGAEHFFAKAGKSYFILRHHFQQASDAFTISFQFNDPPCVPTLNFQSDILPGYSMPNALYQASSVITSQNISLDDDADFVWSAGDSIVIHPDFEMQLGATLELTIKDCEE